MMDFDPKDIVEHLRHNLERYDDRGGLTIFRELLQNADDAEAGVVSLRLLDGWAEARNPLLQGPGLLLVNDGRFDGASAKGMQTFGGSVKATDQEAVGRFGLGQKAVFHICDAFVVVPFGYGEEVEPFVINPFIKLKKEGDACILWNDIGKEDIRLLIAAGEEDSGSLRRLHLWFPLRREGLRPKPKSRGIVPNDCNASRFRSLLNEWHLAEMLACLRHVRKIRVQIGQDSVELDRGGEAERMIGYSMSAGQHAFGGSLSRNFMSVGHERMGPDDFHAELRASEAWPHTRNRETDEMEPQKAAPHGAVCLLLGKDAVGEISADWNVLLPVREALKPIPLPEGQKVKLMLHGSFFVDSGRKQILGFRDSDVDQQGAYQIEARVEAEWNRAVRDELVLPLIPLVLHEAFERKLLSRSSLAGVIRTLNNTAFGREHRQAMAREQVLAQVLEESGRENVAFWRLIPSGPSLRPLPAPDERGRMMIAELLPDLLHWAGRRELTLVCDPGAAITPEEPRWTPEELAEILGGLKPDTFFSKTRTARLAALLEVACGNEDLRQAAAVPVLAALRKALASDMQLTAHEEIRKVLACISCENVIRLPGSAAKRGVLRRLASAEGGPVCIPGNWLEEPEHDEDDSGQKHFAVDEIIPLVEALQHPLQDNRENEATAAGAAAVALLRNIDDLSGALRHPRLQERYILRLHNQPISCAGLLEAVQEKRLFRDTPQARTLHALLTKAALDCGALILPNAIEDIWKELPGDLSLEELSADAACRLLAKTREFGPPGDRAGLLQKIFSDKPQHRGALRALLAGHAGAARDTCRLHALQDAMPALEDKVRELFALDLFAMLVPFSIVDAVGRRKLEQLGVKFLNAEMLGELLERNARELWKLDDALATEIVVSGIADAILEKLPVFRIRSGGWADARGVWQPSTDWPLPDSLRDEVPLLELPADAGARDKAEKLVPRWSPAEQVRFCLSLAEPQRHATDILAALDELASRSRGEAEKLLPSLRDARWLTDPQGNVWAPADVLDLPVSIVDEIRKVFGHALPFVPSSDIEACLSKKGLGLLRDFQAVPDRETSIKRLLEFVERQQLVACMGTRANIERLAPALRRLACHGVELPLPGWPLMSAILKECKNPSIVLEAFAAVRHGEVEDARQWLDAIAHIAEEAFSTDAAGKPEVLKEVARKAFRCGFEQLCSWQNTESIRQALKGVRVPVRNGAWCVADKVACDVRGVSSAHLLADDLADMFVSSLLPAKQGAAGWLIPQAEAGSANRKVDRERGELERQCADSLLPVAERLGRDLPGEAVALLIALVRRSEPFRKVAEEVGIASDIWEKVSGKLKLLEKVSTRRMPGKRYETFLRFDLVKGARTVSVETLTGKRRNLPSDECEKVMLIGDGHWHGRRVKFDSSQNGWLYELKISDADAPVSKENYEEIIRKIARHCLGYDEADLRRLDDLIREFLVDEQATVEEVRERLKDRMPVILRQMKPSRMSPLKKALEEYERKESAIRREDTKSTLEEAKNELWEKLEEEKAHGLIRGFIRKEIESFGYNSTRILFEMLQNADDACFQDRPYDVPQFHVCSSSGMIKFRHWGRLINHPGDAQLEEERLARQHDLFNMLLMNFSEKQGRETGRFGLGFKSVHLIAREVRIASGFVACRILGGMLPHPWPEGRVLSQKGSKDGRRATVIQLHLDPEQAEAAKQALEAFTANARWLPAMTREIRRIEMDGRSYEVEFGETGAEGIRHVLLKGAEPGHALALDLDGETSLFLQLDAVGPSPFSQEVPRFWLLAPLEEECKAGWILNSREFQVDPGRGRLAGTREYRKGLFRRFGKTLGQRLVALHDLVRENWQDFAKAAGLGNQMPEVGPEKFLEALVNVLRRDLEDDLAKYLHEEGRGLHYLLSQRPALPTRLPPPFVSMLYLHDVEWKVAPPVIEKSKVLNKPDWQGLSDMFRSAISDDVARWVRCLTDKPIRQLGMIELLQRELGADPKADPATAERLGELVDDALLEELASSDREALKNWLGKVWFRMADGSWNTASLLPRTADDMLDDEERRIVEFAPDSTIAHPDYRGKALAFYRLARERSGFQRTARRFREWAHEMDDDAARKALLAYVVAGRHGRELARELVEDRPDWLPASAEELRDSDLIRTLTEEEQGQLLTILYPEAARGVATGDFTWDHESFSDEGYSQVSEYMDPEEVLREILDWWEENHEDEGREYNESTWPAQLNVEDLRQDAEGGNRLPWFTFFALGMFRTLPWNMEETHRNFVEQAMRDGWWEEMANARLPEEHAPWVQRLEEFADTQAYRIEFPQWRRTFADLYALARWLPDYVAAFRKLPAVVRKHETFRLSEIWRLSASPIWQSLGLEGAPLTQSLGLGANWMIREAIRRGLWEEDDARVMHPHAWAATTRLRRFFDEKLCRPLADQKNRMDMSPEIHSLVAEYLDEDADFLGDMDLPLQLWSAR